MCGKYLSMGNKRQWLCVTRDKFDQHHVQLVPQMVSRPTWMSQDNHLWSVLDDWWFCHASCHMAWTLREFGPRMSRTQPTILDCLRGIGGLRHKEPHRVGVARLRSIWRIAVQQSLWGVSLDAGKQFIEFDARPPAVLATSPNGLASHVDHVHLWFAHG